MPIIGFGSFGGGGASYINGVVDSSADLPVTLGTPALDSVYLAKVGSGVWLINRKPAGLYVRVANNGVAADWTYLGAFPEVNSSANWELYDGTDPTKELKFDLSGISTSTTRTLTVPNASGTLGWLQSVSSITVSTDHQLTAARNQRVLVNSTGGGSGTAVYLPATGNAEGDRLEVACVGLTSGSLNVRTGQYDFTVSASMGLNEQRTFVYTSGAWTVGTVESHTHAGLGPTFASSAFRVTEPSGLATNRLAFSLSDITAGSTRTLTVPNASGRIQVEGQAIGSTTPAAGTFTTLTAAPTSGSALTLTGGTVTAPAPLISATQTWNNSAVTFTGFRLSATNTASATASLLMDLQVNGTSQASIRRDGRVNCNSITVGGASTMDIGSGVLLIRNAIIGWDNNPLLIQNLDLAIQRDAADTFAQRRGTNAQTFRIYNTYTDASNYERGFMRWSSGVLQIGTERLGTGSAKTLELSVNNNRRIFITESGQVGIGSTTGALASHGLFVDVPASNSTLTSGGVTVRGTTSVTLDNGGDPILRVQSSRVMFGGTTSSFPALKRSSTTLQVRLADDSAFAPLACGALTLNGNLDASTRDIVTDTTTGTKIGTSTTQKIGFFNATPLVQPSSTGVGTSGFTSGGGGNTVHAESTFTGDVGSTAYTISDIVAHLKNLGLIAA